ncbi:hypothetical protein HPB49_022165 [Dermacentor silvarum]|uniref:Uncharacterized protein n=1 Tax=Dermacentor silvarum TaxID=543639 RepID=A0ACB8E3T7_DERSI|nr:ubiquitin-conjugating enzyme E2 Z-like [Dermacentor silvarum]KAH7981170.1 hypothetical protein HPB49_022165 [Dermacentor silvarum]
MNTDAGRIWLATNQNADGMVCLSPLGTWPGQVWKSSVHSIWTVFRVVQSLVTERGFHKKPALVRKRPGRSDAYNNFLLRETCEEVEACLDAYSSSELRKIVLMTFPEPFV